MNIIKRVGPLLHRCILAIFNVRALHKAFQRHLLSREFLVGFACWALSAGVILFQWRTKQPLPEWLMVVLVLFSLFTGISWVLVPVSMYLGRTIDHWMSRRMPERSWLQVLTGARLWHQAASGKLPLQFLATLLVSVLLWLAAFQGRLNQPWQAWMVVAFFVHALFFVVCPLLIFLEKRIQ